MGNLLYGVVDSVALPKPDSSYSKDSFREYKEIEGIPTIFIKHRGDRYLMYYHGNAIDIGIRYDFFKTMSRRLKVNVIGVEYPGYGTYEGCKDSFSQIKSDSVKIYRYLLKRGVDPKKITVVGKSIGTGAASHLAANSKIGGLVLISPFTGILNLIKTISGESVFSSCVSSSAKTVSDEPFDNLEAMRYVNCPTVFIHGTEDKIIPYSHSLELHQNCKSERKKVYTVKEGGHNDLYKTVDLIEVIGKMMG